MTIGKITEITTSSEKSFDDAIKQGIKRASKTLKNIKSAWVKDQEVVLRGGKITLYKVTLKITFILADK